MGGKSQNSWGDLKDMETANTNGIPITAATRTKKSVIAISPPTEREILR
ncbi:hypothetical protein FACS1894141_6040 [Spirochaetia bacterium]|nr:hypothetical protein FACS1894141_6040 [Spirochaetia bacterium]